MLHICVGCTFLQLAVHPSALAVLYMGADKSLAQPRRNQANVSVRMTWISFGILPCRKKLWWQLASRYCWNRARPWHASDLVSFLVGLRTYQHPGTPGVLISHTTFGRSPLDEWSAQRQELYLATHITHKRQTSKLPAGLEPTIPTSERPQTQP